MRGTATVPPPLERPPAVVVDVVVSGLPAAGSEGRPGTVAGAGVPPRVGAAAPGDGVAFGGVSAGSGTVVPLRSVTRSRASSDEVSTTARSNATVTTSTAGAASATP